MVQINLGRFDRGVAENPLQAVDVAGVLQPFDGELVSQVVAAPADLRQAFLTPLPIDPPADLGETGGEFLERAAVTNPENVGADDVPGQPLKCDDYCDG